MLLEPPYRKKKTPTNELFGLPNKCPPTLFYRGRSSSNFSGEQRSQGFKPRQPNCRDWCDTHDTVCHSKSHTTCLIPPFPLSRTTGPRSQMSLSTGNHSLLPRKSMCISQLPHSQHHRAHTSLQRTGLHTCEWTLSSQEPTDSPLLPKRFIIKPAKN